MDTRHSLRGRGAAAWIRTSPRNAPFSVAWNISPLSGRYIAAAFGTPSSRNAAWIP
ncbi:MAG: hypothetical protein IKH98_06860 [Candidatus Methanomethylophilaceae archaeon]|nr:hypothetical protein [Candidatus Methanomethylophilaceae archaeon]